MTYEYDNEYQENGCGLGAALTSKRRVAKTGAGAHGRAVSVRGASSQLMVRMPAGPRGEQQTVYVHDYHSGVYVTHKAFNGPGSFTFALQPGKYRVEVHSGSGTVYGHPFQLWPGQFKTLSLQPVS